MSNKINNIEQHNDINMETMFSRLSKMAKQVNEIHRALFHSVSDAKRCREEQEEIKKRFIAKSIFGETRVPNRKSKT